MEKLPCFLEAKMPPESAPLQVLVDQQATIQEAGTHIQKPLSPKDISNMYSLLLFLPHTIFMLASGFLFLASSISSFLLFYSNPTHPSRFSPYHTFLAKSNSIWRFTKANSFQKLNNTKNYLNNLSLLWVYFFFQLTLKFSEGRNPIFCFISTYSHRKYVGHMRDN